MELRPGIATFILIAAFLICAAVTIYLSF